MLFWPRERLQKQAFSGWNTQQACVAKTKSSSYTLPTNNFYFHPLLFTPLWWGPYLYFFTKSLLYLGLKIWCSIAIDTLPVWVSVAEWCPRLLELSSEISDHLQISGLNCSGYVPFQATRRVKICSLEDGVVLSGKINFREIEAACFYCHWQNRPLIYLLTLSWVDLGSLDL